MKKNFKNLKKNKKGFTLIEIIVVLVIMGILLAIAVPSVLGYVQKAQESQYLSDGRAAYLSAQSIAVREKAKGTAANAISSKITVDTLNDEIGSTTVTNGSCSIDSNSSEITACVFQVTGLSNTKVIKVLPNDGAEIVTETYADITNSTN